MARFIRFTLAVVLIVAASFMCNAQQSAAPIAHLPESLAYARHMFPFHVGEKRTYVLDGEQDAGSGPTEHTEPMHGRYTDTVVAVREVGDDFEIVELSRSGKSDEFADCAPQSGRGATSLWYVLSASAVFVACSRQQESDLESRLSDGLSRDKTVKDADYHLPFQLGDTWGADPDMPPREDTFYEWAVEDRGAISVRAGKFRNCYQLTYRTMPDHEEKWVCAGAGLVADELTHNGTTYHYRIELVSITRATKNR